MESTGRPGCVQLSADTAAAVGLPPGLLDERSVDVKGKGLLTTYVLEGAGERARAAKDAMRAATAASAPAAAAAAAAAALPAAAGSAAQPQPHLRASPRQPQPPQHSASAGALDAASFCEGSGGGLAPGYHTITVVPRIHRFSSSSNGGSSAAAASPSPPMGGGGGAAHAHRRAPARVSLSGSATVLQPPPVGPLAAAGFRQPRASLPRVSITGSLASMDGPSSREATPDLPSPSGRRSWTPWSSAATVGPHGTGGGGGWRAAAAQGGWAGSMLPPPHPLALSHGDAGAARTPRASITSPRASVGGGASRGSGPSVGTAALSLLGTQVVYSMFPPYLFLLLTRFGRTSHLLRHGGAPMQAALNHPMYTALLVWATALFALAACLARFRTALPARIQAALPRVLPALHALLLLTCEPISAS